MLPKGFKHSKKSRALMSRKAQGRYSSKYMSKLAHQRHEKEKKLRVVMKDPKVQKLLKIKLREYETYLQNNSSM